MTGGFLSTMKGPIGPAVVQLPATSQTSWALVNADAVSVPAGTDVVSVKLASALSASPEVVSTPKQVVDTSLACQTESAPKQLTPGGVLSMRTVWNCGASWVPQLSVAWNLTVERPSFCRVTSANEVLMTVVWGMVSAPATA